MAMICINMGRECDGCCDCQEPKLENIQGPCAWCGDPVTRYEARYEFPDGEIVHDGCVLEYIREHYYVPE